MESRLIELDIREKELTKLKISQEKSSKEAKEIIEKAQKEKEELLKSISALNKAKEEFIQEKNATETQLEIKKLLIQSKEKAFKDKEEKVARQEKFLSDWALRLKDQEGALKRARG